MLTNKEQAEPRQAFALAKSTFLKDAKGQHEPKEIISAIEAVTFEELEFAGADGDELLGAFVAAVTRHQGKAESILTYLRLYGSVCRRFSALLMAHAGSVRTAEEIRRLSQEYDELSVPAKAEKLHRLGRESLRIAHEAATLTIDNRDLKGAVAKFKQAERLNDEAGREWYKLAGRR